MRHNPEKVHIQKITDLFQRGGGRYSRDVEDFLRSRRDRDEEEHEILRENGDPRPLKFE